MIVNIPTHVLFKKMLLKTQLNISIRIKQGRLIDFNDDVLSFTLHLT